MSTLLKQQQDDNNKETPETESSNTILPTNTPPETDTISSLSVPLNNTSQMNSNNLPQRLDTSTIQLTHPSESKTNVRRSSYSNKSNKTKKSSSRNNSKTSSHTTNHNFLSVPDHSHRMSLSTHNLSRSFRKAKKNKSSRKRLSETKITKPQNLLSHLETKHSQRGLMNSQRGLMNSQHELMNSQRALMNHDAHPNETLNTLPVHSRMSFLPTVIREREMKHCPLARHHPAPLIPELRMNKDTLKAGNDKGIRTETGTGAEAQHHRHHYQPHHRTSSSHHLSKQSEPSESPNNNFLHRNIIPFCILLVFVALLVGLILWDIISNSNLDVFGQGRNIANIK